MAVDRDNPFGTGQGWATVQSHARRILRGKFYSLRDSPAMLDDLVSEVMCDLLGYWSDLPSSHNEDGTLIFELALHRAVRHGTRLMVDEIKRGQREPTFSYLHTEYEQDQFPGEEEMSHSPREGFGGSWGGGAIDPNPGPEDRVLEDTEQELARQVLATLPPEDLNRYFEGLLSGESARQGAARLGVSASTFNRRTRAEAKELRKRAKEVGLG